MIATRTARLAGRCANGAERDRGYVIHALPMISECSMSSVALCGKTHGRRSAGWVWHSAPLTCPRCKRKLETINAKGEGR